MDKKERLPEIEPAQKPVVVIIDDQGEPYENLIKGFDKNALDVITPPQHHDPVNTELSDGLNRKYEEALENVDFSRVALVIADQFYDDGWARDYTRSWLRRFRLVNKEVVVIETSFWPQAEGVYESTNPVMNSLEFYRLRHLFRNTSVKDKKGVLDFGKRLGNLAFREAQMADPNSKPDNYDLRKGYERQMEHERFFDLLEVISREDEDIGDIEHEIQSRWVGASSVEDLTKDAQIVHAAFVIIFHLERESNPAYYSIAITRLRDYLGIDRS